MNSTKPLVARLAAPVAGALIVSASHAALAAGNTCTWRGPSDGAWSNPANWTCAPAGTVPQTGDTAVFPYFNPDAGAAAVEISGTQGIDTLEVTGRSYTFAPSGDAGLTIGTAATFTGGVGPSRLTLPLSIGSPVTVTTDTSSSLETSGPIAFTTGGALSVHGAFLAVGPVSGPGLLVVSGGSSYLENGANDYDGGTKVVAGALNVTSPGALGSGSVAVSGDGALYLTAGSWSIPNALAIGSPSTPLLWVQPAQQATITWAGPIDLTGPAKIEAVNFVLSGPITSSGGGAVLTLQASSNGPLELSNPHNSYSGGTIVAGMPSLGAVVADYSSSFGTGPVTILGQTANTNAGLVELASGVTLANPIVAQGGAIFSNGSASIAGNVTGTGYYLGAGTGATLEVAGTLGGSADSYGRGLCILGPYYVDSPGTGTVLLALASPATYAGATQIVNATFDLGQKPNPLPPATQVMFGTAGSGFPDSVLAVHANTEIRSLLGNTGSITIDPGATLTIAVGTPALETQYYTGSITGDGGVTFTGDGGNRFPGSSEDGGTYLGEFSYAHAGPTLIAGNPATAPTVVALYASQFGGLTNGSIPNSTVTVAAGGELDIGPGSVLGPTVGAGGTIVPYPGRAASSDAGAASLTLSADTTFRVVYAGLDAGTSSFLAVNGAVSLGGAHLVATSSPSLVAQGPVVVLANRGDAPVEGTFGGLPEGAIVSASGGVLRISYVGGDGNDVTLEVPLEDAGTDGSVGDAGLDATVGMPDAANIDDGAVASDANVPDATVAPDAATPDAGSLAETGVPSSGGDGAAQTPPPVAGGCGCAEAGGGDGSPGAFLGFGAVALFAVRRRRRVAVAP